MVAKKKCATCGVTAVVLREMQVGALHILTLTCGHVMSEVYVGKKDYADIQSADGDRLYPFQVNGAQFAEDSNIRCLIGDEMGLGKTVQALAVLKKHKETVVPALIIVKSGLRLQWAKETIRWTGILPIVVENEHSFIPGFEAYIVSMDLLHKIQGSVLNRIGFKFVIIDEVQQLKNPDAKRTNAVRKIVSGVEHVMALSGTPIKNHVGEYFTILNMLQPRQFPSHYQFLSRWCNTTSGGYGQVKVTGLKDPEAFKEFTKSFILRRTRAEVLPDLPAIQRVHTFHQMGATVARLYEKELERFTDVYYEDPAADCLLAYMSRMRHLTGLAKIDPTVEFVTEFIEETDRKHVIFVHHKDVATILTAKLEAARNANPTQWGRGILNLTADLDMTARNQLVENFWSSDYRVAVMSTLSACEGLNLQCCADATVMERQWNPANEEQAEARFPRPGQTASAITARYPVAVGTIDEFFAELVEKKRAWCASAVDGVAVKWEESSLVQELKAKLASEGLKKWQLQ